MAKNARYVGTPDVAAELGVTAMTVRNWIHSGALPAVKVGRQLKIRRSDYERYLRLCGTRTAAPAP